MTYKSPPLLNGTIIILILWTVLSLTIGFMLIPPPWTVFPLFFRLLLSGSLLLHSLSSLFRLATALLSALIPALLLGMVCGLNPRADRLISPVLYLLYPLPKIAFLPLFMVLFGLGNLSKIALLWTVIFFQLLMAARDGVKSIPSEYHIAGETLFLSPRKKFTSLYLPSTLPRLFSAMRISIGIGMAVLFFAENYASEYGLGYFIMNSWVMINYPMMFAGILALAILSYLLLRGIDFLERKLYFTGQMSTGR